MIDQPSRYRIYAAVACALTVATPRGASAQTSHDGCSDLTNIQRRYRHQDQRFYNPDPGAAQDPRYGELQREIERRLVRCGEPGGDAGARNELMYWRAVFENRMGQNAQSYHHFDEIRCAPPNPQPDPRFCERVARAIEGPRSQVVVIRPTCAVAGATIRFADGYSAALPMERPRVVEAGAVGFTISAPGHRDFVYSHDHAGGESMMDVVSLVPIVERVPIDASTGVDAADAAVDVHEASVRPAEAVRDARSQVGLAAVPPSTVPAWAFVGTGIGLAVVAGGLFIGYEANRAAIASSCDGTSADPSFCVARASMGNEATLAALCQQSAVENSPEARRYCERDGLLLPLAIGFSVGAAASGIIGAILFGRTPRAPQPARVLVLPQGGTASVGLSARWTF